MTFGRSTAEVGSVDADRRVPLGMAGISVGNLLIAVGNALLDGSLVVVGGGLVAATGTGLLAGVWWADPDRFDLETEDGGVRRLLPTLLLGGGAVCLLGGVLLLATALVG